MSKKRDPLFPLYMRKVPMSAPASSETRLRIEEEARYRKLSSYASREYDTGEPQAHGYTEQD